MSVGVDLRECRTGRSVNAMAFSRVRNHMCTGKGKSEPAVVEDAECPEKSDVQDLGIAITR